MTISPKEVEELQRFFSGIKNLPEKLTIKATTYNTLSKFINDGLELLKENSIAPIVAQNRYDDLLEIKRVLIEQGYATV